MKFAAFIFAGLMCLAQGVFADDAETIAAYLEGMYLDTEIDGNTVTVTGSLITPSGNSNSLTLNIDSDVTVVWQATLQGAPSGRYSLINISGGSGTFEVQSGGTIENTGTGRAITNNSASVIKVYEGAKVSSQTRTTGTSIEGNQIFNATIHLADSGTETADRLIISGGTVENTSTSGNGYAYAVFNASTGAVNVSGGTVLAKSDRAIYNYENFARTVTISGGEISTGGIAINCDGGTINISGGTISTTSGTAISCENESHGTVNIFDGTVKATSGDGNAIRTSYFNTINIYGGTVSALGMAIRIGSGAIVNVSDSAYITSTGSGRTDGYYATIYVSTGTLNMDGGTVELSGGTDSYNGGAICNHSSGTINISNGTVQSERHNAILNFGKLKITGGTVLAKDPSVVRNYAILDSASAELTLGGSPAITGRIHIYPEKFGVLNADPDIFAPGEKVYTLDFPADQYAVSKIAVNNGRNFLNSFTLYNIGWVLTTVGAGPNLITAKSAKVSFNPNYTIISENFEGDITFTIENGSQTNKWAVGTATASGSTKSAYISNNGTSNAYTTSSTSVVHIYRSVTFHASGAYNLKFNWKGMGENNYDDLNVRLVESSSPITAGSIPEGISLGTFRGYNSWQQASVNIPATNSGTTKLLVFTWRNDNQVGTQPPIAVDNIVLAVEGPAAFGVLPGSTLSNAQKPSTSIFTRPDYVNDGKWWYMDPAGETEFVFGNGGTAVEQDMTLYLKWTPIDTPSSSSEGGSSSSSSEDTPSSSSVEPSSSSEGISSSSSGGTTPIRLPQIASSNQATQIHNGINLQVIRNAVVEIYGLDGKLIGKQNFSGGVYNVSLGYLPKGLYIVKASFGSEKKMLKVPVR